MQRLILTNPTGEPMPVELFHHAAIEVNQFFGGFEDTATLVGPNRIRVDEHGTIAFDEYAALDADAWKVQNFTNVGLPDAGLVQRAHAGRRPPLVVGLQRIDAPFKGGVLVPSPMLLLSLATSPSGGFVLPFTMPAGLPSGASFFLQAWISDPGASAGFSASNGLQGTTGG